MIWTTERGKKKHTINLGIEFFLFCTNIIRDINGHRDIAQDNKNEDWVSWIIVCILENMTLSAWTSKIVSQYLQINFGTMKITIIGYIEKLFETKPKNIQLLKSLTKQIW